MKRFTVLVLALVLVFGMSTMAFADLASSSIDVDITVDDYAELTIDEASPLELDSIKPGETADGTINYGIRANTSVDVTAAVSDDFGTAEDALSLSIDPDATDTFTYNDGVNDSGDFGITASLDNEAAWEEIQSGDYEATVTLTVAAQ